MNCAEFDEIVHELDRQALRGKSGVAVGPDANGEAALAHAESCDRCGKLLTQVEGLNFALRAIAAQDAREQAPARVEAALLHKFRQQVDAKRREQVRHDWTRLARVKAYAWYGAVAAAAVVAVFALGLIRSRVRLTPDQPARNTPGAPLAVTNSPSPNSAIARNPQQIGRPVVRPKAQQRSSPAAEAENSEEATAFYALPYADDLASLDGGAVIRVTVPRSALASWGVPVSGIGGAGPLPADVVVSADGTPEAIRLVAQSSD